MKKVILAAVLIMSITGCTKRKEIIPNQTEVSVTLTPQELADAFEYRDNKVTDKLIQLQEEVSIIEKQLNELSRNKCNGKMK